MKIPIIRCIPIVLFLCCLPAFAQTAGPRVEPVGAAPDSVPAPLRQALETKGYRVLQADGSPLAQVWLRSDVPSSGKKEVEGANYPMLAPSTFVGVIDFPAPDKDFRGQPIKPGAYVLRYELMPADGNHMGVAPDRDFLLLVRAGDDPGPAAMPSSAELVKLSARAAGTNHPLVLSMVAAPGGALPEATTDPNGYLIFSANLQTSGGALPMAVILKGVSMSF